MKHIAAYLLLQIGGNASPSAADIKKVLGAVGIDADDSRLETLLSELSGKDINELIAEGSSKLASVPSGGGGGGAVAASGGAAAGGGAAAAEEKKEEKKEEEKVRFFTRFFYYYLRLVSDRWCLCDRRSPTTIWASVSSIRYLSMCIAMQCITNATTIS